MTDAQFDACFNAIGSDSFILEQLGKMIRTLDLRNGASYYAINDVSDLRAVVEQELRQKMTGRE